METQEGPTPIPREQSAARSARTFAGDGGRPLRWESSVVYMLSWKVREMTSSCCSFVRLWKFTA